MKKDPGCIFCRIMAGEIPSAIVYEDEEMVALRDANPQMPVHVLAMPRTHFATLSEMDEEGAAAVSHIFRKIPEIADGLGLRNGYRLIVNQGADAGQTVRHLHIHILGGADMGEKIV